MQHVDLKIKELSIKPEIRTSEFDVCSQKVRSLPTLISFMRTIEGFLFSGVDMLTFCFVFII